MKENNVKEKYEIIQEKNEELLKDFKKYLEKIYANPRLIKKKMNNINLLVNDYLAIDFEIKPDEADSFHISEFLDWLIYKWILNTSTELISVLDTTKLFFEWLPGYKNLKEKKKILIICHKKEYYLEKFNEHEKLLEKEY